MSYLNISNCKWLKIRKYAMPLTVGFILLAFMANAIIPYLISEDMSDCGTFGDQFGAVNALFSGIAFAGLIYTIFLQRRDLRNQRKELFLQRKELTRNREEMRQQTEQFEKQNETLKLQRFENTFFQLLQQFESVTEKLTFSYIEDQKGYIRFQDGGWQSTEQNMPRTIITGRELFRMAFEEVPHRIDIRDGYIPDGTLKVNGMRDVLEKRGLLGYHDSFTPTYFDHYFRLMYRILKFVDETALITDEDKYEYTCILRAHLSRYELVWLYYNGLSEYGSEKFKPLIEKYAMLKNLRDDLLVGTCTTSLTYSPEAFEHESRTDSTAESNG